MKSRAIKRKRRTTTKNNDDGKRNLSVKADGKTTRSVNGKSVKTFLLKCAAGFAAGIINGLFGGGGGMIVVPCLRYLLKYKTEHAHATAIAVILPLSVLSGIFYAAFGSAELVPTVCTTVGVTAGGAIGAFLLKKLAAKPVSLIFAVVMAIAGVKMLFF